MFTHTHKQTNKMIWTDQHNRFKNREEREKLMEWTILTIHRERERKYIYKMFCKCTFHLNLGCVCMCICVIGNRERETIFSSLSLLSKTEAEAFGCYRTIAVSGVNVYTDSARIKLNYFQWKYSISSRLEIYRGVCVSWFIKILDLDFLLNFWQSNTHMVIMLLLSSSTLSWSIYDDDFLIQ